ncbi:ribosome maturation factor RimP [Pelagibacterium luteolum]|uniref:Ribosome maturation factor RimP n=1 Tax=Pelagibacterium luteolum TaxID=440168 RepID=A0A1G7VCW4_9HYPH|nr:ribosome maturation factor RimP [Pelagibacterium luteolum]SDG57401.1 ribosome maturation factor RimP [Pelagibacterium luteolum]
MATNTKRYIRESALEARIAGIVEPVAESLGYDLVRIRVTNENGCTLQIMCEDETGRFAIEDCEKLHADLNPILDLEDPIDREYHLEISSPGVDRPLVRARDFITWAGHEAKIELSDMVDGRKRFRGDIVGADDETFSIRLPDAPVGTEPVHTLPLSLLADAKLLMTDKLLDAARKAQEEHPDFDETDEDVETIYTDDTDGSDADERN